MYHKQTRKMFGIGASLALCCALVLSLTACGGEKKTDTKEPSTPVASAPASSGGNGTPSQEAPTIKSEGVNHQNDKLYFITMGDFAKQEDAQAAFEKVSTSLNEGQQKNFWFIAETDWFKDATEAPLESGKESISKGLPQKKFTLAHAYPSTEALEGYRAADYASSFEIKPVYALSASFASDKPIVVLGVDAQ